MDRKWEKCLHIDMLITYKEDDWDVWSKFTKYDFENRIERSDVKPLTMNININCFLTLNDEKLTAEVRGDTIDMMQCGI